MRSAEMFSCRCNDLATLRTTIDIVAKLDDRITGGDADMPSSIRPSRMAFVNNDR
jgi:hypothetical protein